MRPAALLLASTLLASSARAAEPAVVIAHQGRLLDQSDRAVTGPVKLTFRLYAQFEAQPGQTETPLWTGDFASVALHDGAYGVLLGQSDTQPLPASLFKADAPRWMSVSVNGGPELAPRLRLGTVPHASYAVEAGHAASAGDAATLGGRDPAFYTSAANLSGALGSLVSYQGQPIADAFVQGAAAWSAKLDTVVAQAPLSGNGTAQSPLALGAASASADGFLSQGDWARFDQKVSPTDPRLSDARDPKPGSASYIQNGTGAQNASFHLSGSGQLGGDFAVGGLLKLGRTGSCDAGAEGTLRYNATDKRPEFCNGSAWQLLPAVDTRSCLTILQSGGSRGDGVYQVSPGGRAFTVYCDMTSDGGGWTLIGKSDRNNYSTLTQDQYLAVVANVVSDVNPAALLVPTAPADKGMAFLSRAKTNALWAATGGMGVVRVDASLSGNAASNGRFYQQKLGAPASWDLWLAMRDSRQWGLGAATTGYVNGFGTNFVLARDAANYSSTTGLVTHKGDGTFGWWSLATFTLNDGQQYTFSRHAGLLCDGYGDVGAQWMFTLDSADARFRNDTDGPFKTVIWLK